MTDDVLMIISGQLIDTVEFWGADTVRVFSPGNDGMTLAEEVVFTDAPAQSMTPMVTALEKAGSTVSGQVEIAAPGIYFLEVSVGTQKVSAKIVVPTSPSPRSN